MNRMSYFASAALAAVVLLPGAARSQGADNYPSKPVQLVLPFAPGGSSELEGRMFAQRLSENTGRNFLLDFRAGASGVIAVGYVAKAAPDGYTILMGSSGVISTPPAVRTNLPYDSLKDIAPVTLLYKRSIILVVHPSLPIKSATEYIAYAKAHPGQLNFATVGIGSAPHFAGELLHSLTGTKATMVHYKGTGDFMPDLLTGRVQATITSLSSGMPSVKAGKLRLLGVSTLQRTPVLPDTPTLAEQVAAGYDFPFWQGVIAPGGTSPAILNKLSAEFAKAAQSPELNKRLMEEGVIMTLSTPENFRQSLTAEINQFKKMAQDIGIKPEN